MTKKLPLKKQIHRIKKESILWTVIIVLGALLISSSWYIIKTSNNSMGSSTSSIHPPIMQAEKDHMQAFVNDTEQRRYRYPVIDVKENRVYFPEARIYVPLSENSRDIRYQGGEKTLWLSTSMAVGRQTGDSDASCDRVVLLTQSENDSQGYIAAGTITANDGSTRYIFRHPACPIYGDDLSKNLADVIKEAQYY